MIVHLPAATFVTYLFHYFVARSAWEVISGRHVGTDIVIAVLAFAVGSVLGRKVYKWR